MQLIPVILSGGAGSRLWPISREAHPKPFMRLQNGKSLLQNTFSRAAQLPGVLEIITVTNRELFFKTEDEYAPISANLKLSFILEPFGRNTAAAIAAASLDIAKRHDQNALVLVLTADHIINDLQAFNHAVNDACALARDGRIATFGIQPDSPNIGYGYIESEGSNVLRFIEKPSLEKAKEYFDSKRYLWNSGMFCFRAGTLLEEFEKHSPTTLAGTLQSLATARIATGDKFYQLELDSDHFVNVPDISIDYAVMEKTDRISVVPCSIGWSDVGSWNAVSELTQADSSGNRCQGKFYSHESSNCFVHSPDRVTALVGVSNLVIVDTPDALLISTLDRTQEVKHIVKQLKADGHEAYKTHRTAHRPWGIYTVIEEGHRFKIKRIEVNPGKSLSLQLHYHRSEHWIVVSGTAKIINGDSEKLLHINESTYIPAGEKHRLTNPGRVPLIMIEVQSGEYLGEDDIVRFNDNYGRT